MSSNRSLLNLMVMALAVVNIYTQDKLCQQVASASSTVCTLCYLSYYDTVSQKCVAPTTAIANAANYTSNTVVLACMDGYYLKDNTCVAMDATNFANCARGSHNATNGYVCSACKSGFTLVSNVAGSVTTNTCQTTTATNCTVSNCSSCIGSGKVCTTCASGYAILSSDSSCIQSSLANCSVATSATACNTCQQGYYISNSTCSKSAVTVFGKILSLLLVFIL